MNKIITNILYLLAISTIYFLFLPPVTSYAQADGEIIWLDGYFQGNGKTGGPYCGCWYVDKDGRCLSSYPGIRGTFSKDGACKEAYGPEAKEGKLLEDRLSISICDLTSSRGERIECILPPTPTPTIPPPPIAPCAQWKDDDPKSGVCLKVATSLFQGPGQIKSQGDISTDPAQFIVRIFSIVLGFAGGIALLLLLSAGYKLITSKGKPESIQQGKDQLISAVVGLVFIIFSFIIFQLIFSDILKIPLISN